MPDPMTIGGVALLVAAFLAAKRKKGENVAQYNSEYNGADKPGTATPDGEADSALPSVKGPGLLAGVIAKARQSAVKARTSGNTAPLGRPTTVKPATSWRTRTGTEEYEAAAASGSVWQRLRAAPRTFAEAAANLKRPKGVTHGRPAAPTTDQPEGETVSDNTTNGAADKKSAPVSPLLRASRAERACWDEAKRNPDAWDENILAYAERQPDLDYGAHLRSAVETVRTKINGMRAAMEHDCREAARKQGDSGDWTTAVRAKAGKDGLSQFLMDWAIKTVTDERWTAGVKDAQAREQAKRDRACDRCKNTRRIHPSPADDLPCPDCRPQEYAETQTQRPQEAAKPCTRCGNDRTLVLTADNQLVPTNLAERTTAGQRYVPCPDCRPKEYAQAQTRRGGNAKTPEQARAEQKQREQAAGHAGATGASGASGSDPAAVLAFAQSLAAANVGGLSLPQLFKLLESFEEVSNGLARVISTVGNRLGDEAKFDARIVEHITGAASTQRSVSSRLNDGHTLAKGLYRAYLDVVSRGQVPSRDVLTASRNG
uniref:hypothetical protein n=1 Tax=Nonomuraea sp. CA-251285 TaxID=3240002 RepID=UPI003F495198